MSFDQNFLEVWIWITDCYMATLLLVPPFPGLPWGRRALSDPGTPECDWVLSPPSSWGGKEIHLWVGCQGETVKDRGQSQNVESLHVLDTRGTTSSRTRVLPRGLQYGCLQLTEQLDLQPLGVSSPAAAVRRGGWVWIQTARSWAEITHFPWDFVWLFHMLTRSQGASLVGPLP